jgi:mannose-1-phosphate guanylyltransferase
VPDARAFAAAVLRAAAAAADAQVLVTLGVRPPGPETGYGYIELGARVPGHPGLHRVRRFVEKPDAARARRFLRRGTFLWNAGVFVWTTQAILEEIERCAPELHAALEPVRRARAGAADAKARAAAYARAPSLPVDVAVLERSERVWTLPVSFPWSDVGTWGSLAEALGVRNGGGATGTGQVVREDAEGNLDWGGRGRLVALLGVQGLAVVDTPDALLVARLERSGDVRRLVERLREAGREDLI